MNLPALIAGLLCVVAFVVHVTVGAREATLFTPETSSRLPYQAWVQTLGAFHWVSVDLLGSAILLLVIGVSDALPYESMLLLALGVYFAACGVAFLATVAIAGRAVERRYLRLGQWIFCFVVAALALFGR